jgi:hypothetical protein
MMGVGRCLAGGVVLLSGLWCLELTRDLTAALELWRETRGRLLWDQRAGRQWYCQARQAPARCRVELGVRRGMRFQDPCGEAGVSPKGALERTWRLSALCPLWPTDGRIPAGSWVWRGFVIEFRR